MMESAKQNEKLFLIFQRDFKIEQRMTQLIVSYKEITERTNKLFAFFYLLLYSIVQIS